MYSYTRINTNTTAQIGGSRPVRLVRVVINTKGASSNKMNIYDGVDANGTFVGSIDTTAAVGNIEYDLILNKGLFINIPNVGTAPDATIIYG